MDQRKLCITVCRRKDVGKNRLTLYFLFPNIKYIDEYTMETKDYVFKTITEDCDPNTLKGLVIHSYFEYDGATAPYELKVMLESIKEKRKSFLEMWKDIIREAW